MIDLIQKPAWTIWNRLMTGALALMVFGVLGFGAALAKHPLPSPDKPAGLFVPDHRVKNRQSATKLSPAEYESEAEYYVAIMQASDPRQSLDELQKNSEGDPALQTACHPLAHEIGRKAYDKYQDFNDTMMYMVEICNSGYLHGVIEEKFSTSPDIYTDLLTICQNQDEGRCLHGVGHGIMYYTQNDLPKSLEMCELFAAGQQTYCAEGAFMENFNTDPKTHPSKYLSQTDYFYPCAGQKEKFKYACYYYAPRYYISSHTDSAGVFDWCSTAESKFVFQCVRGVGAVLVIDNIGNPKVAETGCMTARSDQLRYCIDGVAGFYLNHYNSMDKAYVMCETLLESNRETCRTSVRSRQNLFE